MFSLREKQFIASEIEKLLLGLNHSEMPKEKPKFALTILGKENWSSAQIEPNWVFGINNPPSINPFNEVQKGEVIYIDGYYLDGDKKDTEFKNYMCVIGEWNGNENDHDIFYYFKDEEDLKSHMVTENNTNNEFVITKVHKANKS